MVENNLIPSDVNVDQIGIVVRDLHAMAENLYRILGIGPFRIMEWPIDGIDPESTYHGEPEQYRLLLGFARQGSTQIELIEPLEGRNIWSDFLDNHGPGLHHFRLVVTDFDEKVSALEKAGIENIASGTGALFGSKWAYFDTSKILDGIYIELRTHLAGENGEGQWAIEGDESGA
jgi:methylmalonyl-CoA/ethylmalonyl-CoA epimerase